MILSALGITFVHAHFFKSQRLKLIDRQIAEVSSALLQSDEFINSARTPEAIDDVISSVLKGARIGKLFIVRDLNGEIIFQSFNVSLLEADVPTRTEWVAIKTANEYVRVKNIPLAGAHPVILQVGLVLDRNFFDWEIIDSRVIYYVSGLVLALFLTSAILTLILLAPLRLLIAHLREVTATLINLKSVRPLPRSLTQYTQGFWRKSDEFSVLLGTMQKLIDRININIKLKRSWTLQMAHELKTPLAIIRAQMDTNRGTNLMSQGLYRDVVDEIDRMSGTISQFLDWADLENSHLQKDLPTLRIKSAVKSVASRLEKIFPGRIRLRLENDFSVNVNPFHLDQVISNLTSNALKFSPSDQSIDLVIARNFLMVKDRGSGLSQEVQERLGEPFNIGTSESGLTGNGLGLAWVTTVAKLYQWSFEIKSGGAGTDAFIFFPAEDS